MIPRRTFLISAANWRKLVASTPPQDENFARDVEDPAELLRRKRQAILDTARRWGVYNLRIFGSLARGQAKAGSDVDLLVDLKPGKTLLDLAGFQREVMDLLDIPIDVATPDMLKDHVRAEILRESLPLYTRQADTHGIPAG